MKRYLTKQKKKKMYKSFKLTNSQIHGKNPIEHFFKVLKRNVNKSKHSNKIKFFKVIEYIIFETLFRN